MPLSPMSRAAVLPDDAKDVFSLGPPRRKKCRKAAQTSKVAAVQEIASVASQGPASDNKLRRLQKQLRLIVALEAKVVKGFMPSPDQRAKLARRAAMEAEVASLSADTHRPDGPAMPVANVQDAPHKTSIPKKKKKKVAVKHETHTTPLEDDPVVDQSVVAVTKLSQVVDDVVDAASSTELSEPKLLGAKKKPVKRKKREEAISTADHSTPGAKKQKLSDGSAVPPSLGAAAFHKAHEIVVDGLCPPPLETFHAAEAGLGTELVSALRLQGYTAPTPIQAQSWPIALQGQDMVAVAKTGSGKTCGFLMPVLARLRERARPLPKPGCPAIPSVLVLAPTRELCQQIAGEAEKFSVAANTKVASLYGGVPKGDQIRQLKLGADIVIATPGRLLDFCTGDLGKGLSPLVSLERVTYLVLDEADRMLDMGFEPDIRKIAGQCAKPGRPEQGGAAFGNASGTARQTLFFTATWPTAVQRTAASLTCQAAVQVRIGQGAGGDELTANANVKQVVSVVEEKQKLSLLKGIIDKELGPGETAFIFAKCRHTCDFLEQKLWDEKEDLSIGTWCRAIHSKRTQWERDASLATFRSLTMGKDNGRRGILVATDVAARGLDIPGVALVVCYDFGGGGLGQDSDVESYVHRIGRTGRAGLTGKAFTFFTEYDKGSPKFVELLEGANQKVPDMLRTLAEKEANRRGSKGSSNGSSKGKGKGGKGYGKGSKGGGAGRNDYGNQKW